MSAIQVGRICVIYAVIGGLHLIDASEEKIEKSIEALLEVKWVFAGHCTGFDGMRRIASVMGDRFGQIHSGTIIHLPVKGDSPPVSTIPTAARDLNLKMTIDSPVKYVSSIASKAGLDQKTQNRAIKILREARKAKVTYGKEPAGIAASALYIASLSNAEKTSQKCLATTGSL